MVVTASISPPGGAPPPISVVKSVVKEEVKTCLLDISEFLEISERGLSETFNAEQKPVSFERLKQLDAFVIDNVLSPAECSYLVDTSERMGYSFWDQDKDRASTFRNADTIEVKQVDIAEILWQRIKPFFEKNLEVEKGQQRWQCDLQGEWSPVGTNTRLLFARYDEGGHFSPHTDGFDIVNFDHRSMYSIVLFLNTCPSGGGTRFYKDEQREKLVQDSHGRYTGLPELVEATVESKAGRMIVFYHNIMHEGIAVNSGKKYIIRSDVMYQRLEPVCASERDKEAFVLYQEAETLSNNGEVDEAMKLFRRAFKMSPALAEVYGC
mmetsp:Transcript_7340/g.8424  ORF Transcript_7340/g.8424 Transcript_7340/m.8424 type:complete len:323 (+) Transcript_7340:102-1070(+)